MFEELNQFKSRDLLSIVYVLNKALNHKIAPEDLEISYPISEEGVRVVKKILNKIQKTKNKPITSLTQDEIETYKEGLSRISTQCSQKLIKTKLKNPSKLINELNEIKLYPKIESPPISPEVKELISMNDEPLTTRELLALMREIESQKILIDEKQNFREVILGAPKMLMEIRDILDDTGFLSEKEFHKLFDKFEKDL